MVGPVTTTDGGAADFSTNVDLAFDKRKDMQRELERQRCRLAVKIVEKKTGFMGGAP